MSLGLEMLAKTVLQQLMAKVQIDQTQVENYKTLIENFFKSHQVLIDSHLEIKDLLDKLINEEKVRAKRFEVDHDRINSLMSREFKCQHCGAEHTYDDRTSGEN